MRYAENTSISSGKSREEIERTLQRYGATGFIYGWNGSSAVIAFEMNERSIQFNLPMPDRNDERFRQTPTGRMRRNPIQIESEWEQACRQKWRALSLCIKAKLEAVESEITTFEHEFLAHFKTSDGRTVGEHIIPQLNTRSIPRLQLPS